MLMSKSRLEKFLYALYSLDSSDLPNPLSRIEELYKCLVTGEEVPSFEPISRVEKYLMAILGAYDVDSLPNPLSRAEVLLHKLAIGDDNLDDIKSFLSEYEELLAEVIRNGGVGGNIDIEYVLYSLSTEFNTLYNTAEKPVKSAILKGQTLVNLSPFKSLKDVTPSVLGENSVAWHGSITKDYFNPYIFKPNTKYIVKFGMGTPSRFKGMYISGLNMPNKNGYYSEHNDVFTTPETTQTEGVNVYFKGIDGNVVTKEEYSKIEPMIIEYREGMENWSIPYFEGIQSIKMPVLKTVGKNLFNCTNVEDINNSYTVVNMNNKNYITTDTLVEKGKQYTLSLHANISGATGNILSLGYMNYSNIVGGVERASHNIVTIDSMVDKTISITFTAQTTDYIKINIATGKEGYNVVLSNVQIEEGSIATSYESFKSNILTCNEEVVLRGVGDVQDTLDLMTGELTERIGEVVLDGSEGWKSSTTKDNTQVFNLSANNPKLKNIAKNGMLMCDKLKVASGVDDEIISFTSSLYISLLKSKASTVEELKVYLSQNPIIFIHKLVAESVKTVDLSVVDRDGNNTELSTFDDLTHVTLSSEGLIPEAELEVATKNKEVLSTMSLEMNDISTTQNALQETSDIQSENVDATMIATTEIYEELL